MSYGICDDLGVWLVVPDGPFATQDLAQAECDKRNFEDGCANEEGELLQEIPLAQWNTYYVKHRSRPDCTCRPARDPLTEGLDVSPGRRAE
jgi:hypothetical protein